MKIVLSLFILISSLSVYSANNERVPNSEGQTLTISSIPILKNLAYSVIRDCNNEKNLMKNSQGKETAFSYSCIGFGNLYSISIYSNKKKIITFSSEPNSQSIIVLPYKNTQIQIDLNN